MRKQAIVGWIVVLCLALGFGASTASGAGYLRNLVGTVTDPCREWWPWRQSHGYHQCLEGHDLKRSCSDQRTALFSVTHLMPDNYRVRNRCPRI